MQTHLKPRREIRHDRRRRTKRQPMDRTFRSSDSDNGGGAVRKPENGHDDGGTEEKRPDHTGRYDAVRKSEASHRPDLQVERAPGSDRVSGRRTRSRKSRNNRRVMTKPPALKQMPNAQRPTSNVQCRRTLSAVRCSAFDVRRSMFSAALTAEPTRCGPT